jgi:hypothetical protein
MIDRVDLLIAVMGMVVSVLGSSTAMWLALSKKPDRAELVRVETKLDAMEDRIGSRLDAMDDRIVGRLAMIEVTLARIDERLASVERSP